MLKKLTEIIQRLGEKQGAKKKEELKLKYPDGLLCEVTESNYICTRGKYRSKPWNRIWTKSIFSVPYENDNIYQAVQEYKGVSGDFIVSIITFPEFKLKDSHGKELAFTDIVNRKLRLVDYFVIFHRGLWILANIESLIQNRKIIGRFSSVEIYPKDQNIIIE